MDSKKEAPPFQTSNMASFPSPLERTVASALLLLSTPPASELITCYEDGEKQGKSMSGLQSLSFMLASDESKSCASSLTADHQFSSRKQKLRVIAAVARCHDIKLKVVKKRRSKIYRSSDNWKISAFKSPISSNMASETSCLSSSSSGISSARSQCKTTKAEKMQTATKQRKRSNGGSTHIGRRAEAILKLLSGGCFPEFYIRRLLGDSPDTSKALRMLLKKEEVKRSGTGGQKDPYIYMIA